MSWSILRLAHAGWSSCHSTFSFCVCLQASHCAVRALAFSGLGHPSRLLPFCQRVIPPSSYRKEIIVVVGVSSLPKSNDSLCLNSVGTLMAGIPRPLSVAHLGSGNACWISCLLSLWICFLIRMWGLIPVGHFSSVRSRQSVYTGLSWALNEGTTGAGHCWFRSVSNLQESVTVNADCRIFWVPDLMAVHIAHGVSEWPRRCWVCREGQCPG